MARGSLRKVMWLGRATVFLVGLAVILGLLFGVASAALGANGTPILLGKHNVATTITRLVGPSGVDGAMMQITNNNRQPDDTALTLAVDPGEPPMRVNSRQKVAKLNADTVDGHNTPLWAVIDSSSGLSRSNGAATDHKLGTGERVVMFDRDVRECAYAATLAAGPPGEIVAEQYAPATGGEGVAVHTFTSDGSAADKSFHLTVSC